MTTGPAGPTGGTGPLRPQAHGQPGAGDGPDHGDEDVLFLAGQRPPAEGAWLLVTGVEGAPGGKFTAQVLPAADALALGGDVVVRVDPMTRQRAGRRLQPRFRCMRCWAGSWSRVASWPAQDLDAWPEQIRPAVAFAMGVLTELEEHDADLSAHRQVDLALAAGQATAGFPLHLTFPLGKAAPQLP